MKTKQTYMRAIFNKECDNAINMEDSREVSARYLLIDKKTERTIVDCRAYMGKSAQASTVYASLWVSGIKAGKHPADWKYPGTTGRGSAGGYGYHKTSAAIADAIRCAGIGLYGSPYGRPSNDDTSAQTLATLKNPAHIGGCGDTSVRCALLAIAYAAGYPDCIFVTA